MLKRAEESPAPAAASVALMLTRRCNMSCEHCSVESGPRVRGEPTAAELMGTVRDAAAAGIRFILLTGGEPMLREEIVLDLLREASRLGMACGLTTNGFWGRKDARRKLAALLDAGLTQLTVSYDRYHAAFQGHEPLLNIAEAAGELRFRFGVSVTRQADDEELDRIVAPLSRLDHVHIRFYDVQAVGRARGLPTEELRGETKGFCSACDSPAITDDGRVVACNGPAYFAREGSPLLVGSLRGEPLPVLLRRHRDDPVLDTIRVFGPERLRDELREIPGFRHFPLRARYSGICDLCQHLTSTPTAVEALRARLAEPARVAERHAARMVMAAGRAPTGALNRAHVNHAGSARVLLAAARQGHACPEARWDAGAERVLGRADLDWSRLADQAVVCGLARPLLPVLDDPKLTRWAPDFFVERIRAAALREAVQDAVRRHALAVVDEALGELGGRGVLLKGAAMAAMAWDDEAADPAGAAATRGFGDIDLLVAPRIAPRLHALLRERGFTGAAAPARTGHHHLPAVSFRGTPVEIHTRILDSRLRVPEKEILAHARPLRRLASLSVLDGEGQILHALMHASQHFFYFGLKCGWDVAWIVARHPALDWRRVRRWADASRRPLGFHVPARLLAVHLGLPIPPELFDDDATERRRYLDAIALRNLFADVRGHPGSRSVQAAISLLLCSSIREAVGEAPSMLRAGTDVMARGWRETRGAEPAARIGVRSWLRGELSHWGQIRALARTTPSSNRS